MNSSDYKEASSPKWAAQMSEAKLKPTWHASYTSWSYDVSHKKPALIENGIHFLNTNQYIRNANAVIPPTAGQKGMSFQKPTIAFIEVAIKSADFEASKPYSIISAP